jgi:hypothetical protein
MEKEKLKVHYEYAALEITLFETCDIVTTSGDSWLGDSTSDKNGWT